MHVHHNQGAQKACEYAYCCWHQLFLVVAVSFFAANRETKQIAPLENYFTLRGVWVSGLEMAER
jgi:hypothetical protein